MTNTTGQPTSSATRKKRVYEEDPELMAQLMTVPELDVKRAVKGLGGYNQLYLKLVRDFNREQANRPEELSGLFATQNWVEVRRIAHSLKTFAAYIGAFELSANCGTLEDQAAASNVEGPLLESTIEHLKQILTRLAPLLSQPEPQSAQPFCIESFKTGLEAIIPMLVKSDLGVEDHLPDLVNLCQSSDYLPDMQALCELVDDLDFEQAAADALKLLERVSEG